jgi:hypothetical protein
VLEKAALVAEKKPAALSQPAQRPVSMSGLKGLLNNATNSKQLEISKQPAGQQQSANTRKTLNKRATVFKDHLEPLSENSELASKESNTESKEGNNKGNPRITSTETAQQDNAKKEPVLSDDLSESQLSDEASLVRSEADDGEKDVSEAEDDDCKVQIVTGKSRAINAAPDVKGNTKTSRRSATAPLPSHESLPHQSEPEEYWDDEDEENDEDDGYITARSYRSRSENTTGGATTLLFPRYNQQVKRELALAKQVVESTRTVEDIEDDYCDTSMVAEYSEEIFEYMREQEVCHTCWRERFEIYLTSHRSKCFRTRITWTTRLRFNGPCGLSSWTGLCRSTIDSRCFPRLSSCASTILTVFSLARLCHLGNCSL